MPAENSPFHILLVLPVLAGFLVTLLSAVSSEVTGVSTLTACGLSSPVVLSHW